jgi:uncharacterized lipoprotein NlpE involved in copper resistance
MIKFKYIIALLLVLIFIGCNDKKEETESEKINRLVNER